MAGRAAGALGGLRRALRLSARSEDVQDFLGLVQVDEVGGAGILVLPDQVTALLRATGTDFRYAPDKAEAIVSGFERLLNKSGVSFQLFYVTRPYRWDLPGEYLDGLADAVGGVDPESWAARRYEQHRQALLEGEVAQALNTWPLDEQCWIAVHAPATTLDSATFARVASGLEDEAEKPVFIAPRAGWRFWEQLRGFFSGEDALEDWERVKAEVAGRLAAEVDALAARVSTVPGLEVRRASALEAVQLLHYLWRGTEAMDDGIWIPDRAALDAIRGGEAEGD